MIETAVFICLIIIRYPPIAPIRQTKEPQLRSMLPPVSMHISMPQARIKTYAFCVIKALNCIGWNIIPLVVIVKKTKTRTRTMSMVLSFNRVFASFFIFPPPLLFLLGYDIEQNRNQENQAFHDTLVVR